MPARNTNSREDGKEGCSWFRAGKETKDRHETLTRRATPARVRYEARPHRRRMHTRSGAHCCLHSSGLTFWFAPAPRPLGGPRRLAGTSSSESESWRNAKVSREQRNKGTGYKHTSSSKSSSSSSSSSMSSKSSSSSSKSSYSSALPVK